MDGRGIDGSRPAAPTATWGTTTVTGMDQGDSGRQGRLEAARDALAYIAASPSPWHAAATTAERLGAAGFVQRQETDEWTNSAGRWFVVRGASLCAWIEPETAPHSPTVIVGAHTDSPNLRIKPNPESRSAGADVLSVEVYGGVLLNSWLDRDLGLSGRVTTAGGDHLVRVDDAVARIPQLAIHLDRDVNNGLQLNRQTHLRPMWALSAEAGSFVPWLQEQISTEEDVLGWELMFHDTQPGVLCGRDNELIATARIDNLLSCWAATTALIDAPGDTRAMICLFDHEEVGSESSTGAGSSLMSTLLERIVSAANGTRDDLHRCLAGSLFVSADGAHATHPNYPERHDPNHLIALNGGPVVKINSNVRYATDSQTAARFIEACGTAGVPHQTFVSRNDIPCGSTIGPVSAARLGISTVDAGMAQLAMHSARETAGSEDPAMFVAALGALFSG